MWFIPSVPYIPQKAPNVVKFLPIWTFCLNAQKPLQEIFLNFDMSWQTFFGTKYFNQKKLHVENLEKKLEMMSVNAILDMNLIEKYASDHYETWRDNSVPWALAAV